MSDKLDPNWLAADLDEAASDWALHTAPTDPERRLEGHDARRLREKMAARYAEWTGRDLAVDLRAE